MDALEAIFTRRSIRKFTSQPVSETFVETILRAAMSAPSAGNQQPWHFIVVDDRTLMDQIPTFCPYAAMCREAPLGILVCGDTALEKHQGFWVQDCSAATQNLLLAAHALGLGAVWTGVYPRNERVRGFRELLKIPSHVIPFAFVVIGYPAEHPQPVDRFRPDRIRRNLW
ncbi:MAG: nitroreductase family protein [Syntrophales bacterium]|nr:nitroreductase family protein [Syntrophales bacterium]